MAAFSANSSAVSRYGASVVQTSPRETGSPNPCKPRYTAAGSGTPQCAVSGCPGQYSPHICQGEYIEKRYIRHTACNVKCVAILLDCDQPAIHIESESLALSLINALRYPISFRSCVLKLCDEGALPGTSRCANPLVANSPSALATLAPPSVSASLFLPCPLHSSV